MLLFQANSDSWTLPLFFISKELFQFYKKEKNDL